MDLKQPSPLQLTARSNPSEQWKKWKQRYDLYFVASQAGEKLKDDAKISLLLHVMGDEGIEIYNTFEFEKETRNYETIVEKFDSYFQPLKNETMCRHLFFTRNKGCEESFEEYVMALKKLSQDCAFENLRDSLIRDQIIRGISDKSLRERLLKEQKLDLTKCVNMCKMAETTQQQMKKFEEEPSVAVVNINKNKKYNIIKKQGDFIRKNETSPDFQSKERPTVKKMCQRCGYVHGYKCPAYKVKCNKCYKMGHYGKMCKTKVSSILNEHDNVSNDYQLGMLKVHSVCTNNELCESLKINDQIINFKLDTGSDCNVLPLKNIKSLKLRHIINDNNKTLYNYDGTKIKCIGKIKLNCELVNGNKVKLLFYIVDSECIPVLGFDTIKMLGLMERKYLRIIKTDNKQYEKNNR
ncbi:uncharacterized protein LOC119188801 [Manduca sexta]|uniref:uncharacterized protein LOC119188801 n=1 Tax=Manduca sexta TaxID=7130 RepID=UPI001890206A|nr:uncharacterized protein LOC119188801 [Manduca sexta]